MMSTKHSIIAVFIFGICLNTAHGLHCYHCLEGETTSLCNVTATRTQCQNTQDGCFTQVKADGSTGRLTSYKTCMDSETCSVLESSNPEGCERGVIDSSCTWCCSSDRCNHDRQTYKRPSIQSPDTNTAPPGVTSQCVPVATSNCTQSDLEHCITGYKRDVDDVIVNNTDVDTFCRNVPDVIMCLTDALESCYHPGALLGVTSLLEVAVTSLKAQCPGGGCDETSAILCTSNFLIKVTRIILSPGGSCELLKREVVAFKQCIDVIVSSCGSQMVTRYHIVATSLSTTISAICPVLPSTIHPPTTAVYTGATVYTTSGVYVTTTSPWQPAASTRPWWHSTSAKPPTTTTTTQSTTTTTKPETTTTAVPSPTWTTSTMPPPTESPECQVDEAILCINDLSGEIAKQMGQDRPDFTEICNDKFEDSTECARSKTRRCSGFIQNRIEVLIEYLRSLLDGACDATTAPPGECDTAMARTCLVTLLTLVERKDISDACRYRANATACIDEHTRDCSTEERDSLYKVLNDTIDGISDQCIDVVMCPDDTVIIIEEGGDSKRIFFNFTQPPSVICGNTPGCKVIVDFLPNDIKSPRCSNGVPITQIVLGNTDPNSGDATPHCSREITEENWRREHSVTITARVDFSRDGDQRRDFTVVIRKVIFGVQVERRTVCTYQVIIIDRDSTSVCKSLNDPHIHTFDKMYYNNHYQGIFRMYQHTEYPYEVQVAYQRCEPNKVPTCNCAVYVRAGDTVFVVDKCRRTTRCRRNCSPRLRTSLYYHDGVTPGMHIFSSVNGRVFDVVLPHGTRVRINDADNTLINIYIYPSPFDWSSTTGLCGVFDGDKKTDIVDVDGKFYSIYRLSNIRYRMYREQVLSWRVSPDEYLTDGYGRDPYVAPSVCLCDAPLDQKDGSPVQTAGPQHLTETCNLGLGKDVTYLLPRKSSPKYGTDITIQVTGRRKRYTGEDNIPDFDLEYDPFTVVSDDAASGTWDMTSARQYCWDYLQGDPAVQGCLAVPNIDLDLEMEICTDDIMTTGLTTWAPRARESVLEKCEYELRTNPVYIETDIGRTLADGVLGGMCPGDCSGHGQCSRGVCDCSDLYIGPDCSLSAGGALQGLSVEDGGLCDTSVGDCDTITVYGDNIVNTGSVVCHFSLIKMIDSDEDNNNQTTESEAEVFSYQELSCHLPSKHQSYNVKVTLDGVTFSRDLMYVPYDSNCYTCDESGVISCTRKDYTCVIDGMCYTSGSTHSEDQCLVCAPGQSGSSLSRKKSFSCIPGSIAIATIIAIVVILIVIITVACIIFKRKRGLSKQKKPEEATSDVSTSFMKQ